MTEAAPELLAVTTDDGVRLATDHYRTGPDGSALGTVLIRTPYGRGGCSGQARAWLRAGYSVLVQDVRGRYDSEGDWEPYDSEGRDGAAVVHRLADHGVLSGPLILAGASYDAHCAVECARALEAARTMNGQRAVTPFAVLAMVPALGLYETAHAPDGRPRLLDRIGWWHQHGFAGESRPPLAKTELRRRHLLARSSGMDWVRESLVKDSEYGSGSAAKWRRLWESPPLDLTARYGNLTSPLLVISGNKDFFTAEALSLAEAWGSTATGTRVETLWGPWGHRLSNNLNAETAVAFRREGGLMARIEAFLAGVASTAPDKSRTAWLWGQSPVHPTWAWWPTTTEHLRRHGEP